MGDFYREQLTRLGYEDEVRRIRHAWDEGGRAAGTDAVPDALVESIHFAGPVQACVERIAALEEAGVDMVSVNVDSADPNEMANILRKLCS
jgi:hypothetical protein